MRYSVCCWRQWRVGSVRWRRRKCSCEEGGVWLLGVLEVAEAMRCAQLCILLETVEGTLCSLKVLQVLLAAPSGGSSHKC